MGDHLTVLTLTGDRPACFALCEQFMARQTYAEAVQWLVVDDGITRTPTTMGQSVLRRTPASRMEKDLLPGSLRAAWDGRYITGSVVAFIEDDDYYPPDYLATMVETLGTAQMAGENPYRYYHVGKRLWAHSEDRPLSSLSRTIIRTDALGRLPRHAWDANCNYFDCRLWKCGEIRDKRLVHLPDRHACIGMKGMPGRTGVSPAHDPRYDDYRPDNDLSVLRRWMGDDAAHYTPFLGSTS